MAVHALVAEARNLIGAYESAFEVIANAHTVDRVVTDTAKAGLVSEGGTTGFRAQDVPNPSGWR